MAVQAQFGGLAGCQLLPYGGGGAGGLAEEQLQALLLSAATGNKQAQQQYHCAAGVASAAQSELTCNGGGAVALRKRSREYADLEPAQHYHHATVPSSSAALLPIPDSALASTSGRPLPPPPPTAAVDAILAAELIQHGAEVDALVRAGCDRLRTGLERARKRHCEAVALAAARALRGRERELDFARRRAVELEERLRQAAVETQAWCGLARSNEAAASGLRATLDALILRTGGGVGCGTAALRVGGEQQQQEEGFGESAGGGTDDAESCCFVVDRAAAALAAEDDAVAPPASAKWACMACGGGEASVLVLPCRHLCLCKACEPRADACPSAPAPRTPRSTSRPTERIASAGPAIPAATPAK